MAVFIPDIFSGYLSGMRQANQDNWTDLTNYNKVLEGQLQNAYKTATFDPNVRQEWNNASVSDMNTMLKTLQARRGANQFALNNLLGIDEASAMAQLNAIGRGDIASGMKTDLDAQNYGIAKQYGQEKADAEMERLRQQNEAYKAQLAAFNNKQAGNTTAGTNPYAIGTNLNGNGATPQPTVAQDQFNFDASGLNNNYDFGLPQF